MDGRLQAIPYEQCFSGFDKSEHGLVEVNFFEQCGLVFVQQDTPTQVKNPLERVSTLLQPSQMIIGKNEATVEANRQFILKFFWKVIIFNLRT